MPDDTKHNEQLLKLENELLQQKRYEKISRTLFQVSNAVSLTTEPDQLYRSIHQSLGTIIDATNFYIALYHLEDDRLSFPYCVDEVDGTYPDALNVSKSSSLTAEVVRTGQPLMVTREQMIKKRAQTVFLAPACSLSEIWLGVPLKVSDKIIGVMAVQNYSDRHRYTRDDLDILSSVAGQVATAIEYKRTEEARKESEARYAAIVQQATDGIYILDPQTKIILDANTAFLKMIGRSKSEIGSLYVYDFVRHPKVEIDRIIDQIRSKKSENNRGFIIGERTYLKKDGTPFYVEASASHITYSGKSLLSVIVRDITERLATERALRESERRYRRLINNATDAVYLADEKGRLVDVNNAACQMLGYSREELLSLKMTDVDTLISEKELIEIIRDKAYGFSTQFESMYRQKNGEVVPVEISSVIYHEDDKKYVLGIARDITERKMAEEKLRVSSKRIEAFFSSISDAIMVHPYREEGFSNFIEVNDIACTRYGYTREEFLTLSPADITKKSEARLHAMRDNRLLLKKVGNLVFEGTHIKKNGEEFPVEINSNVIEQPDQTIILAVVRDITERKQAQQEREILEHQLHQAQKMDSIGRLAGGIAHDFNNMLSVILGHAELALLEIDRSHRAYPNLQEINQAAEHSAELTRQLLAFARKQPVSPKVLDLNETIAGMLEMLRRLIGEDIILEWLPSEHLPIIKADPVQISQVLTNLCVNARDAIGGQSHGRILISTRDITAAEIAQLHPPSEIQHYIGITVADNGQGIEPDLLPQIFEPFFTTKNIGQGTGLGLSTVYGIIKQNNGLISVESMQGEGFSFHIYLPAHTDQPGTHAPREKEKTVPGKIRNDGKTILVVEDEAAILSLCRTILEKSGFRVHTALTPSRAIEIAREHAEEIDLLLSDVVLPEMNGQELADKIKPICPGSRLLFMSGYTADIISRRKNLDGSIRLIEKPFSAKTLLDNINAILENHC